jgi:hypothetical protein
MGDKVVTAYLKVQPEISVGGPRTCNSEQGPLVGSCEHKNEHQVQ